MDSGVAVPTAQPDSSVEQLIVLPSPDPSLFEETVAVINELGGRVSQVYGPRVLLANLPDEGREGLDQALEGIFPPQGAEGAPFPMAVGESLGIDAWNLRASPEFTEAKGQRPRVGVSWAEDPPDLPEEEGETPESEAPFGAPPPNTSKFLIGSVAVGLILVNGPTPALQFTGNERTKVIAEVQDGLGWLAAQEPRANITWVYDIRDVNVVVPANFQPENNSYEAKEAPWRNAAMAQLGFSASFQGVWDYVLAIRQQYQTDWAYVAFFTKGYPIHHFAYASKPRLVMDYFNGGWGPDSIAEVFTHETGHIFGCPDEYSTVTKLCQCNTQYGFLKEINGNCDQCPTPQINCLMGANERALCNYTRIHFGWRDSDGDGILDPLS
ncbi:MAG TPA: hypothetical protein VF707_04135 [Ardenticatenaceae bacterium]|jgi:hypothetical protein